MYSMTLGSMRHRILATFAELKSQKSCLNEVNLDFCDFIQVVLR